MPHEEDIVRLRHMRDAAREACRFLAGRSMADLEADTMLNFAVRHALGIIGEAAGRVSEHTRIMLPAIPWRNITGMRHRLIHAYFDVDTTILWDTITVSLPALLTALDQFLDRYDACRAAGKDADVEARCRARRDVRNTGEK